MAMKVKRVRLINGAYYWQPTPAVKALGFRAEALGRDPITAAQRAQALNRSVDQSRREGADRQAGPIPDSMADLIRRYRAHARFQRLAPRTKRDYEQSMALIERNSGSEMVAKVTRQDVAEVYEQLQSKGLTTANRHMRVLAVLLKHAWNIGMRSDNPAAEMGLVAPPSRKQVWAPRQVERLCVTAELVGLPSIALAARLALDTGQRPADVLRLTWSAWDGAAFTLTQAKTGTVVRVPVSSELRQMLNASNRGDRVQIVISEATGRAYKQFHFAHVFADVRRAARLPDDLQFRDFRRTAATDLGGAGATDDEIRAVTGHKSRSVVAIYVRPDDRMAAAGQAKRFRNKSEPKV